MCMRDIGTLFHFCSSKSRRLCRQMRGLGPLPCLAITLLMRLVRVTQLDMEEEEEKEEEEEEYVQDAITKVTPTTIQHHKYT